MPENLTPAGRAALAAEEGPRQPSEIAVALAVLTRDHPTPWKYDEHYDTIDDAKDCEIVDAFDLSKEEANALVRLVNAVAAVAQAEGREGDGA